MSYQIRVIKPFERAVKALSKKFRKIKKDLQKATTSLEQNPHIGVPIPGYEGALWKLRIVNTSAKRGKSGGFRLIYLIEETATSCYLLTIYSKTEKIDVNADELEELLTILEEDFFSDSDQEKKE